MPISMVASSAMLLVVHPSLPAANVKQLIALARAKPGAVTYASSGSGSTAHLSGELFKNMARVEPAARALQGRGAGADRPCGRAGADDDYRCFLHAAVPPGRPEAGSGSRARSASRPARRADHCRAAARLRSGHLVWRLSAPAGTPRPVVDKLNQSLVKIFVTPDAQARLAAVGAQVRTNTPEQFAQAVSKERAKWAVIIRESGARAE